MNATCTTIDIDNHDLNFIALVEDGGGIFDTTSGNLGSAQVTININSQVDDSTFGLYGLDSSFEHLATLVFVDKVAEWIAFELLDTKSDALFFNINTINNCVDLFAALVIAYGLLATACPSQVGQVDQAIDATVQSYKNTTICNRLDSTTDTITAIVVHGELFPWV